MAAIATSQEHSVRAVGTEVTVPNYDVCRLSYYLNCCTLGCGVDIIVDDLVDFRNAHTLPQHRQDAIYELATDEFKISEVLDKTIFLDEEGDLCEDRDNEFLELKQVTNILAISSSATLGGKQVQVTKVMVFRPRWLKRNYYEPLNRRQGRTAISKSVQVLARLLEDIVVEDVTESKSDHCAHCKGLDGNCACKRGCAPQNSTKCSAVHHCNHCKGFEGGACACKNGCPKSEYSKCAVVHESIVCDSCKAEGLQGKRYKCEKCFNYDLCEDCYQAGKHETTHPFSMIERIGSRPIHQIPRKEPTKQNDSMQQQAHNADRSSNCSTSLFPTQQTVVHASTLRGDGQNSLRSFIGETMSIAEMKGYLENNGVSYVGATEKRELKKLVWETQVESISAGELKAFMDTQGITTAAQCSVLEERRAAKAAFETIQSTEQSRQKSRPSFCAGDRVYLVGLKKQSMNGKLATVVTNELVNGRVQVQLVGSKQRFNVKVENLELSSEDLD